MKAIRKLCASNGEYQKDGETRKRWQRVGTMFKDDDGRVSIKLDSIPVGPDWSGWLSAFPMDDAQHQGPTTTRNVHDREAAIREANARRDEIASPGYDQDGDDILF